MPHPKKSYRESSFLCPENHVTKSWQWDDIHLVLCSTCGRDAERLNHFQPRMAQAFKPPVVAYNPQTKEYRPLASEKSRAPRGFQKVELKTQPEINHFLKGMDERDYRAHQEKVEREQRGAEGRVDPYRDYRPQTALGERMMRQAEEASRRQYQPRFSSGNYIEAFEFNPSSMKDD